MTPNNGNGTKWAKYLAGLLWGAVVLFLSSLSGYVIANDQASRERDHSIEENVASLERRISERITIMQTTQDKGFTDVLVSIERLKMRIDLDERRMQ